jgi:cardiolipin synthase (CMP-forming)
MCILAVYLIVKEVVMALMGLVVMKRANRRLDGAKWYGKVCTAVLYVCMLALVAFPHMPVNLQYVIMIVCAAVLTFAFIMYIRIYIIMLKDNHYGNDERKLY